MSIYQYEKDYSIDDVYVSIIESSENKAKSKVRCVVNRAFYDLSNKRKL